MKYFDSECDVDVRVIVGLSRVVRRFDLQRNHS